MLAALSHHISQLDQRIEEQAQEIDSLKQRSLETAWPPHCVCASDVNTLRAQVKDNRARIEGVAARFERFVCLASASGAGTSGNAFESILGFYGDADDDEPRKQAPQTSSERFDYISRVQCVVQSSLNDTLFH